VTLRFMKMTAGITADDDHVTRVRDAYLEPWSQFGTRDELLRSFDVARTVGGISDVLTEDRHIRASGLQVPPDNIRAIPYMLREVLAEV
jgi:hypothetical protein